MQKWQQNCQNLPFFLDFSGIFHQFPPPKFFSSISPKKNFSSISPKKNFINFPKFPLRSFLARLTYQNSCEGWILQVKCEMSRNVIASILVVYHTRVLTFWLVIERECPEMSNSESLYLTNILSSTSIALIIPIIFINSKTPHKCQSTNMLMAMVCNICINFKLHKTNFNIHKFNIVDRKKYYSPFFCILNCITDNKYI